MDTKSEGFKDLKNISVPLAYVKGEPYLTAPKDLYLPPDALEVVLESFEGPLDLLLYLIKSQNFDILELPVAKITDQYIQYIELMQELKLELAAEYMLMAATLAEIKSKFLLPQRNEGSDEEDDPRAELIRRLQEYERYKEASNKIEKLPRVNRDFYIASSALPEFESKENLASVDLSQIAQVFAELIERQKLNVNHVIEFEKLSTREKMSYILDLLVNDKYLDFFKICIVEEGKIGIIVNFLALLELVKDSLITLIQSEDFGQIHLSAKEEIH